MVRCCGLIGGVSVWFNTDKHLDRHPYRGIGFMFPSQRIMSLPILAALVAGIAVIGQPAMVRAGYCGAVSYRNCPTVACRTSDEYCTARVRSRTEYKEMKETVWEPKEYKVFKTVYDTVCEKIPVQCTRTIQETRYRNECYTVKIPTCETRYREETYTVCRKVPQTRYKTVTYKTRKTV